MHHFALLQLMVAVPEFESEKWLCIFQIITQNPRKYNSSSSCDLGPFVPCYAPLKTLHKTWGILNISVIKRPKEWPWEPWGMIDISKFKRFIWPWKHIPIRANKKAAQLLGSAFDNSIGINPKENMPEKAFICLWILYFKSGKILTSVLLF